MTNPAVGMFGLGGLGLPIAECIARTIPVLGYDPAGHASAHGGLAIARSPAEVVRESEIVVLCLPSPEVSLAVLSEIAATEGRLARLVVELSTIGLDASAESAEIARRAGLGYVDSPVSGSQSRAATGDLTVMAAGAAADIEAVMPVLEAIAHHVFVLGERAGLGQAMKLANNIINAAGFAVTSEAIVFGTRMGLDMAQMVEVLNVSTGRTSSSDEKFPASVVPRTFAFGAHGEIILKDAHLFLEAAQGVGVHTRVAAATEALWAEHVRAHPEVDLTRLFAFVEDDEPAQR